MSPATHQTSSSKASYSFQVYDRPGLTLPPSNHTQLIHDLRALASTCLDPIPDYQCLSYSPYALDDKLIVVMHPSGAPHHVVAFVSAVYLSIALAPGSAPTTVLHTGLTCVAPGSRRQGLLAPLFLRLFGHLRAQPAFARGLWLTSLAEVASSLGNIAQYAADVFPAPGSGRPSATHLRIADAVAERYRDAMLIEPGARFDRDSFVFRGSNPLGSCFRKDTEDVRYHHRDRKVNEYYRGLLGRNEGNEVLQVGFLDWEKVFGMVDKVQRVESWMRERARL
ncbi:hypothetical protein PHLGIDRAFT_163270 [Phlebiopsis gigantea 11061_1 CR5-6]|uniref:Uncharacterized protein n=1 Tax=Phlebiopsis gigantea (strain 11061_1 CR5-6) TaxID=745531 RepID=A0A0C3S4U8_PHLG1|nr:hypothetical protein PHLGIDRAFT_163270 [Phlebiopsis gigantea 11061_1 CR5-6]